MKRILLLTTLCIGTNIFAMTKEKDLPIQCTSHAQELAGQNKKIRDQETINKKLEELKCTRPFTLAEPCVERDEWLREITGIPAGKLTEDEKSHHQMRLIFQRLLRFQILKKCPAIAVNVPLSDHIESICVPEWYEETRAPDVKRHQAVVLLKHDDGSYKSLHAAVIANDPKAVRDMLEIKKIDPNEKDEYGDTPLHYAIAFGHYQITKLLIDHGGSASEENPGNGLKPNELINESFNGRRYATLWGSVWAGTKALFPDDNQIKRRRLPEDQDK